MTAVNVLLVKLNAAELVGCLETGQPVWISIGCSFNFASLVLIPLHMP